MVWSSKNSSIPGHLSEVGEGLLWIRRGTAMGFGGSRDVERETKSTKSGRHYCSRSESAVGVKGEGEDREFKDD